MRAHAHAHTHLLTPGTRPLIHRSQAVKDSEALRKAVEEVQPEKVKLTLRLSQSKPLYQAFRAVRDGDLWPTLTEAQQRLVESELRDFVLGGVALEVRPPCCGCVGGWACGGGGVGWVEGVGGGGMGPPALRVSEPSADRGAAGPPAGCGAAQGSSRRRAVPASFVANLVWAPCPGDVCCRGGACTPVAACLPADLRARQTSASTGSSRELSQLATMLSRRSCFPSSPFPLQGEARERFNEIQQELSQTATKFSNNVLDATKAYKKLITDKAQASAQSSQSSPSRARAQLCPALPSLAQPSQSCSLARA